MSTPIQQIDRHIRGFGMVFCLLAMLALAGCKSTNEAEPASVDPGTTPGDVGKVTFVYRGQQVTYATVRAKDNTIWSQQDMGSSRVATQMQDTLAYGDFFQWGRWDDGHQIRSPKPEVQTQSLSTNNPSGVKSPANARLITTWWNGGTANDQWTANTPAEASVTNGCDPCRAMGAGWRLPTGVEWKELVRIEEIKNSATAFASTLKIPTGGYRGYTITNIYAAGADSWYWSSTPSGSRGIGVWIRPATISDSYADTRAWGTSVRCIKN
jgi:hypothetical protein